MQKYPKILQKKKNKKKKKRKLRKKGNGSKPSSNRPERNRARIEVWFQDELRAGQQGSLSRAWAKKGTRPRRIRQRQYKSSYIYGAICPKKDKGCALVLPYASTEGMQIHLDEISKNVTRGYHAIIVMDGAGWHVANDLKIPNNITLMKLPPYSPELNPMEQVFQQLRKLKLSNACYDSHEEIDNACVDAWNEFISEKGAIKRLASRKWANVN